MKQPCAAAGGPGEVHTAGGSWSEPEAGARPPSVQLLLSDARRQRGPGTDPPRCLGKLRRGGGPVRRVHVGPSAAGVAMAELQQLRVQEAVDSMVKSIERENIRKMQVAVRAPSGGSPEFAAPSHSLRAMSRATVPLHADPGRDVPGVAAVSSEAGLALRQKIWSFG